MEFLTGVDVTAYLEWAMETYGSLMVLVGTILTGEIAILTGFILSVQGWFSVGLVFLFAIVGTLIADFFWFSMGRLFPNWIQGLPLFKALSASTVFQLQMRVKNQALTLLIMKYLYGFRWITIVYLASYNKISARNFIIYDILGTVIFVLSLAAIGIPAGAGIYNLVPAYRSVVGIVTAIAFALLISTCLRLVINYFRKSWSPTSINAQ
jgi:membrane protein DedA with SNARE-associated domain